MILDWDFPAISMALNRNTAFLQTSCFTFVACYFKNKLLLFLDTTSNAPLQASP